MDEKYVWAIGSAAAGWITAQLTAVLRRWIYQRWIKRAVVSELRQIYDETARLNHALTRELQSHSVGRIEVAGNLPISNFVFVNHYKDAVLAFTRVQRTALQMIHSYLDILNARMRSTESEAVELKHKAVNETLAKADFELYGETLKASLHLVAILRWHIHHYLTHPLFPELEPSGPSHPKYLKFLDETTGDIDRIIEKAKEELKPRDFDGFYDPRAFPDEPM